MKMKFRDLGKQYESLKSEIDNAIQDVIDSGTFIGGEPVSLLRDELKDYVNRKYCITCGNGTDALTMVLKAWNIGKNDAVFVPDFTFFASAEVVAFEGATPVFYDVCEDTYNANIASLEKAIEGVKHEGKLNPRAIIAVDLFGLPADYHQLNNVAKKHGLLLLEDGAQGFGGRIGNERACSFGDAATTSFFPAKPLGCYGDGGAIFTDDPDIAAYIESIAVHGKGSYKYDNVRIGWNSRLDTLQAAILRCKLKAFKELELDAVNKIAKMYTESLTDYIKVPVVPENFYSSWAQYTIQAESEQQRSKIQEKLREEGIPTMVYYPKAMHMQEAFRDIQKYVDCPVTEKLCTTVLSLPMHPYMTEEEVEKITFLIKKCLN